MLAREYPSIPARPSIKRQATETVGDDGYVLAPTIDGTDHELAVHGSDPRSERGLVGKALRFGEQGVEPIGDLGFGPVVDVAFEDEGVVVAFDHPNRVARVCHVTNDDRRAFVGDPPNVPIVAVGRPDGPFERLAG